MYVHVGDEKIRLKKKALILKKKEAILPVENDFFTCH